MNSKERNTFLSAELQCLLYIEVWRQDEALAQGETLGQVFHWTLEKGNTERKKWRIKTKQIRTELNWWKQAACSKKISIVSSRSYSSRSGNWKLLDRNVGAKNDNVNFLEVASSEHTSTSAQFLEEYQVPRYLECIVHHKSSIWKIWCHQAILNNLSLWNTLMSIELKASHSKHKMHDYHRNHPTFLPYPKLVSSFCHCR